MPYHLLHCDPKLSVGDPDSGNLLVQGDNLIALKALLPYYAGKVKCIYIDPPYNTGNENWVYNDAVNSPEIRKWLGKAVGPQAEDLSRHDKWLCMMYPRLALLREFLRRDGLLFVSIDDNEAALLKLLLDELFGPRNFVQQIVWKNKYGPGAMTRGFGNIHEYIFCYSRNPILSIEAPLSPDEASKYRNRDSRYELRGGYVTQPLATRSKDDRPNLVYPIVHRGEEIWPDKQWIWARERMMAAIQNDELVIRKSRGKWSARFKQYLRGEDGRVRLAKPISILLGPFNQVGTREIERIFGEKAFSNPKPSTLISYLISMIVNGHEDNSFLVLDSFAGSGTTGHAVLAANKADGGRRRFILVEMEPQVCRDITAQRLARAVQGYGETAALGGGFRYCTLGEPLFDESGNIRDTVRFPELAAHIFFAETGSPIPKQATGRTPLLGVHAGIAVYLLFNGVMGDTRPNGGNILTNDILRRLPPHPEGDGPRVVYGEGTRLSEARFHREGIT
ncbi:MAG: site-specific DNA-methyltransferase, partial [Thermoleophilia bacterium]|nr:site-specific DNA-methyltransferase [Thermoleophilia bacterium]